MGIGDKQRIERERREKYAEAIWPGIWNNSDLVKDTMNRVIALVDAEIEPLQEQIEQDGERIAAQITAGLERNALRDALRREIAHMARENDNMSRYWGSRLQTLLDAEVPEPEYEYGLRLKDHAPSEVGLARFASREEAERHIAYDSPEQWRVSRRVKTRWEDVQ